MKILAPKVHLASIILFVIVFLGSAMTYGGEWRYVEKYRYEARPATGEAGEMETVEMEVRHGEGSITYSSKISSLKSREDIRIEVDREGRFISGARQVIS